MTKALLAVSVLLLATTTAACARRPATTVASAPAPSDGARAAVGAPAPGSTATPAAPGAGAVTGAPARPAPAEFRAIADVADIHFDFDRYAIRPEDAKILERNAVWLKGHRDHIVLIEGHCDERGTSAYNLSLGERRARAAQQYLVGQGVEPRRINIVSYGEEKPQCTARTEGCWASNRRAHFLVKPQ